MASDPKSSNLPNSVRVLSSLSEIARNDWDACANPGWPSDDPLESSSQEISYNPFLSHDYLWSL
ncbi:MAG: hypothetical protein ABJZ69_19205, partial [Hyphomicrobiales bacterium]